MKFFIVLLCMVLVSSLAIATTYNKLTGVYRIAGETFYDAPENEPKNTHFYIELSGVAAKDLYKTMTVKPSPDDCIDNGALTKRVGNMQCTRSADKKTYQCNFGIDVDNQKITNGVIC